MTTLQAGGVVSAPSSQPIAGLCSVPLDILLELVGLLDLQDAISLTMVCRRLRQVADDRTFWFHVLKTAQESTVLACPTSDDLSKYTNESLRAIALQTHRRNINLSSPKPRIMGPTTVLPCPGPQEFITEVPGTYLIVTRCLKTGLAICWDVQRKKAIHSFYVGRRMFKVTRLLEGPGKLLIILPVSELKLDIYPTSFVFLRVNFGTNPLAADQPFQRICRHDLPDDFEVETYCSNTHWTVMLNSAAPSLRLFVFNNFTGKSSVIKTDLESRNGRRRLDLSFGGQDLYLIIQHINYRRHMEFTDFYRCPSDVFSQATEGEALSVVTWNCDGTFEEYPATPAINGFVKYKIHETSCSDPDGRLFMTAYQASYRLLKHETVVYKFWSLSQSADAKSIATVHRFAIPGSLRRSLDKQLLFAASYTGRYYVSLGEYGSSSRDWSMRLVCYDIESRQSSVRTLPLPSTIPGLAVVKSLLFDENLGILYLLLLEGTIYSIPYA